MPDTPDEEPIPKPPQADPEMTPDPSHPAINPDTLKCSDKWNQNF